MPSLKNKDLIPRVPPYCESWARLDPSKLLRSQIHLKNGWISDPMGQLRTLLSESPGLRKAIREDPTFEPLGKLYKFRVLTGMQMPIPVDNIKIPEVGGPKPRL